MRLGPGAVPDQLEAFLALEPGQHGLELGHRVPGADRQRGHRDVAADRGRPRASTRLQPQSADALGHGQQRRLGCVVYAVISRWFSFGGGGHCGRVRIECREHPGGTACMRGMRRSILAGACDPQVTSPRHPSDRPATLRLSRAASLRHRHPVRRRTARSISTAFDARCSGCTLPPAPTASWCRGLHRRGGRRSRSPNPTPCWRRAGAPRRPHAGARRYRPVRHRQDHRAWCGAPARSAPTPRWW